MTLIYFQKFCVGVKDHNPRSGGEPKEKDEKVGTMEQVKRLHKYMSKEREGDSVQLTPAFGSSFL